MGGLLAAAVAFGQQETAEAPACDCPSCREKAVSGKAFTLPGLEGMEQDTGSMEQGAENGEQDDHVVHDHDSDAHAGHQHDTDEDADHGPDGEAAHAGHDHGKHAGDGLALSTEMIKKAGIQTRAAEGGSIARATVFPAEIKLNRDRAAAVSPRFESIVRQVFAEIGDPVKKGDLLASLENRETMAVYTIAAPLDGVVISKNLAPGETAGEDKVLFEVADLSSVWADISIFPEYQHRLRKGMPVEFIAHDGHTAHGRVKYISPIVSHETRTITARCVLEGADEDFTPGVFVRARIHIETAEVAVAVPREAVQILEGEPVVFVPADAGFITVPVELGLADDRHVEIRGGLAPGAEYVAVGAFALKAQMVTSGMDPHAGHGH